MPGPSLRPFALEYVINRTNTASSAAQRSQRRPRSDLKSRCDQRNAARSGNCGAAKIAARWLRPYRKSGVRFERATGYGLPNSQIRTRWRGFTCHGARAKRIECGQLVGETGGADAFPARLSLAYQSSKSSLQKIISPRDDAFKEATSAR